MAYSARMRALPVAKGSFAKTYWIGVPPVSRSAIQTGLSDGVRALVALIVEPQAMSCSGETKSLPFLHQDTVTNQ